ncbi:MAG: helix-turn-helix domain-containing protein [Bacilli bacterium]|jgi:transcriptional regulator with XRE-family HTH domain|nr:helix-turn-helix domain-containing protein [Bacilli bacterium]
MRIEELLEQKHETKYQLAKKSKVPYSTLFDILSGKTPLPKCTADTVYRLSKALGVTMESLLESYQDPRVDFELFKSFVCHQVKSMGDLDFIADIIKEDPISQYYKKGWYPECLYLLAMTDYLSKSHEIPLCSRYNTLRSKRLPELVYPKSVLAEYVVTKDKSVKERAVKNSLKEFLQYNIVEGDIRNVA